MVQEWPQHSGEVAEWLKAAVLKTVERVIHVPGVRIPPSPPAELLRHQNWEGAGEVERGRLLSGCGVYSSTEGSNPSLPARNVKTGRTSTLPAGFSLPSDQIIVPRADHR